MSSPACLLEMILFYIAICIIDLQINYTKRSSYQLQGARIEERLDDAINVLRSHCEPHMNMPIGIDPASLAGHPFVPSQAPQSQISGVGLNQDTAAGPAVPTIPVKVEKSSAPSASSKLKLIIKFNYQ